MLLKRQQELSFIPNARQFLWIVHVLPQLEDLRKDPFLHIPEPRVTAVEAHQCMALQPQEDHMEVEHPCMDHKRPCMEILALVLHTMDHR